MILLKLMARRGYPTPAPMVYGDTHTYDYPNGLRIIMEPRYGSFAVYDRNDCRVITVKLIAAYRRISDWTEAQ